MGPLAIISALDFAGGIIKGVGEGISQATTGKSLDEATDGGIPNPINGLLNIASDIVNGAGEGVHTGADAVAGVLDKGGDLLSGIPILGPVANAIGDVAGGIVGGAGDLVSGASEFVSGTVDSVDDAVSVPMSALGFDYGESHHEKEIQAKEGKTYSNPIEAWGDTGLSGLLSWAGTSLFGGGGNSAGVGETQEQQIQSQAAADAYVSSGQAEVQAGWGEAMESVAPTDTVTTSQTAADVGASGATYSAGPSM